MAGADGSVFAARLYCCFVMEYDIPTVLDDDTATLGTTLWVIYLMRFKLRCKFLCGKSSFSYTSCCLLCSLVNSDIAVSLVSLILVSLGPLICASSIFYLQKKNELSWNLARESILEILILY